MRTILNKSFGIGRERAYENTVMFDNDVILIPTQHEFTFSRDDKYHTIIIPDQEISLEISNIEQLVKIFETIGYKVSFPEGKIVLSLNSEIPVELMTKVQDSRLRLRRKSSNQGESVKISYKRPLQRAGIKREIEYETIVGNFKDAETLLSILGFFEKTSYERFRTTWKTIVNGRKLKIELDEFPFGIYIEIEGPNNLLIKKVANKIGIDSSAHIETSYDGIYNNIMLSRGLEPQPHIRFETNNED
jgi:adenylate cyclase class IV